jgi:hypothetical protein
MKGLSLGSPIGELPVNAESLVAEFWTRNLDFARTPGRQVWASRLAFEARHVSSDMRGRARHGLSFDDTDPGRSTKTSRPRCWRMSPPSNVVIGSGPRLALTRISTTCHGIRTIPTVARSRIGHPFGATGARDLSQTVKELWSRPEASHVIVSVPNAPSEIFGCLST